MRHPTRKKSVRIIHLDDGNHGDELNGNVRASGYTTLCAVSLVEYFPLISMVYVYGITKRAFCYFPQNPHMRCECIKTTTTKASKRPQHFARGMKLVQDPLMSSFLHCLLCFFSTVFLSISISFPPPYF